MPCSVTLNLSPGGLNWMDSACYDPDDNLIIGVRGGRVFACNPATGAILAQGDYQQLGLGSATICYDTALKRCFASCWNTGHYNPLEPGAIRNLYRIVPTLIGQAGMVDSIIPFLSTFGLSIAYGSMQAGFAQLKCVSPFIYGVGWSGGNPDMMVFRFKDDLTIKVVQDLGLSIYPRFDYASIGGHDQLWWVDQIGNNISGWDFNSSSQIFGTSDNTKNILALAFAPSVSKFFVTDEFQLIYQFTTTGTVGGATIDTGRSTFNGVNIQYNPFDGFVYAAGGADGTVAAINPAVPSPPRIITGFDLAWDFVFTPTAKFVVGQGGTPLKSFT